MNALHGHFKPEFLNRVDDIIVFRPLGKEQLVKIIELRLEDVRRLLADRKISLELTDAAKDLLFTEGFDPNFGARPLKRAIQKLVQDPLALKILDGEVLHGDHVVVDADKKAGKMVFEVSKRVGEKEPAKARQVSHVGASVLAAVSELASRGTAARRRGRSRLHQSCVSAIAQFPFSPYHPVSGYRQKHSRSEAANRVGGAGRGRFII